MYIANPVTVPDKKICSQLLERQAQSRFPSVLQELFIIHLVMFKALKILNGQYVTTQFNKECYSGTHTSCVDYFHLFANFIYFPIATRKDKV